MLAAYQFSRNMAHCARDPALFPDPWIDPFPESERIPAEFASPRQPAEFGGNVVQQHIAGTNFDSFTDRHIGYAIDIKGS